MVEAIAICDKDFIYLFIFAFFSSLYRLFRRTSRAPLTSVTEEDNKSAFRSNTLRHASLPTSSNPVSSKKAEFTRSLDESNLSGAFKSLPSRGSHYKTRRTPPPPPLPIQNGNVDVIKETRDTTEALQDLDEFLDLLSATPTDRIDKQRGSLPGNRKPLINEDSGSDTGDDMNITIPKYYLPTNSSVPQERYQGYQRRLSAMGELGGNSPPAFSMPNLSAKAELDHQDHMLRNYTNKGSPYAYSTSLQQGTSPEQHSPEEPTGHMMYVQRSHDTHLIEERDEPLEERNNHRRYFSESGGYDVPSRQHHSFHSERPTQLFQQHHQYSKPHHKKTSSSYAAPGVGIGGRTREQNDDPDQVAVGGTWYDANGGGASSQEDGFLSPTKRLMDGERRTPSPLAMTSYTSTENRYG